MDWIHRAQERNQWRACEHGNELSGSVKCMKFLAWLNDCWLV
jgi:hypothetical protein